jgi:uncharacterized protein YndB with AHSA1/START domain
MQAPDGNVMWGRWVFRDIVAPERLTMVSSFSDANAGITRHPGAPMWPAEMLGTTTFAAQGARTLLTTHTIAFNATEEECKAFEAGFEGMKLGFSGTFDQFEAYLATLAGNA